MSSHLRRAASVFPALLLGIACQATTGCDHNDAKLAERFDGERAWKGLEAQVAFGPRPSGTPANESCRAWIETELRGMGLEPKRETFKSGTPAGEIEFANVYADFASKDPKANWILLGSHFDTKRMPFPFVGANDGASSTAVLIEVARALVAGGPREFTYRFVFFDGEEALRHDWVDPDNTYGSRHHAERLKNSGRNLDVKAFVLLDMVGDKDLKLTRDTYSEGRFVDVFFGAARKHGLGAHVDGKSMEVRDDHLSFMNVGIRSIDLIDFEYGPNNGHWHTAEDVVANCSKESLTAIGRIVLHGLPDLEALLAGR